MHHHSIHLRLRRAVLLLSALLLCCVASAQTAEKLADYARNIITFNREHPQEKVYLHMDNRSYFIGDTIWFKAYVMNATTLHPTQQSGVLYVELLNEKGVEMEHKKLRLENGMCHGGFVLKDDYRTGYYEIRAYTRNMLNFGNEEKLCVGGAAIVMRPAVIDNYNEGARYKLDPLSENSEKHYEDIRSDIVAPYNYCIFSRVFPIYARPVIDGEYEKKMEFYPLHTTLAMPQEINYELRPNDLKLSFFPEGGVLVDGVTSVVAFEAIDQWGRKRDISGCILGERKDTVYRFSTTSRGRGTFFLTPKAGKKYHASVMYKGKKYSFQLPKAIPQSHTLRITPPVGQGPASVYVMAAPDAPSKLLGLTLQCRGELLTFDTLTVHQADVKRIRLPYEAMRAGVNQITLFDESGKILADRLFFVSPPQQTAELVLNGLPDSIRPYERIKLDFIIKDSVNFFKNGCFSLAVTDADEEYETYDNGDIRSELLLSSDLKGFIEDVDSYFRHDNPREMAADIDMLMLVQGWRRYDWQQMSGVQPYQQRYSPEKGLAVDGYVVSGCMPYKANKYQASLYSRIPNLKLEASIYEKSTIWKDTIHLDSLGRFHIDVKTHISGEKGMELKVHPTDGNVKALKKQLPYIILNRAFSPYAQPYSFYQNHTPLDFELLDWDSSTPLSDTKMIDEVRVKKGHRRSHEFYQERPEFIIDYYKEWNHVIDRGVPLALARPSTISGMGTKVNLDYSLCRVNIPLTYLEIHTSSGAFDWSYCLPQRVKVYSNLLSREGVLFLDKENEELMQTVCVAEADQEIVTPKKPPFESQNNMRITYFEGYSQSCSFYERDYSDCVLPDISDYRRTLHWDPNVTTDNLGRASVTFYNNRKNKHLHIRAEGFTRNGEFIVYDSEQK